MRSQTTTSISSAKVELKTNGTEYEEFVALIKKAIIAYATQKDKKNFPQYAEYDLDLIKSSHLSPHRKMDITIIDKLFVQNTEVNALAKAIIKHMKIIETGVDICFFNVRGSSMLRNRIYSVFHNKCPDVFYDDKPSENQGEQIKLLVQENLKLKQIILDMSNRLERTQRLNSDLMRQRTLSTQSGGKPGLIQDLGELESLMNDSKPDSTRGDKGFSLTNMKFR